nr:uncharacterized protein LOC106619330 [Bactrocera oleae]
MASQLTSRLFTTFLLVCFLGDFTSSFMLPTLFGSIVSEKFSLLSPLFTSGADNRPTSFSPIVYVIVSPIDGESAATTQATSSGPVSLEMTTVGATELPATVATTPVLEAQPAIANTPAAPVGVNGEAIESPPEIAQ